MLVILRLGLVPLITAVPTAGTPPGEVGAENVMVGLVLYPAPGLFTVTEATRYVVCITGTPVAVTPRVAGD